MTHGEDGLTLVELVIVLAITALVTSLTGTALRSFLVVTRTGSEQLAVLGDQRTSSWWLRRDAQMFPATGIGVAPGTLALNDGLQQTVYSQAGEWLVRAHSSGGVTSTITVARHLVPSGFSVSLEGELLNTTITSTQGGTSRTWTELIWLRVRAGPNS